MERLIRYEHAETRLHKLDGRVKIIILFFSVLLLYIFDDLFVLIAMFIASLAFSALGGAHKKISKVIAVACLPFFLFFVLAIGFSPGFSPNRTPIISFNVLGFAPTLYLEGVMHVTLWTLRIATAIGLTLLFTLTTHPSHLTGVLISMRVPYKYVYGFIAALQLMPILSREARRVYEAQISRAFNANVGIIDRIKNILLFMVPLTLSTIERTYARAIALESRGFSSPRRKTLLYHPKFKLADYITLFIFGVLVGICFYAILFIGRAPVWTYVTGGIKI